MWRFHHIATRQVVGKVRFLRHTADYTRRKRTPLLAAQLHLAFRILPRQVRREIQKLALWKMVRTIET